MALKFISSFVGRTLFEVEDIRRLSLYATLRPDDLKDLKYFGDNSLKQKAATKNDRTRISLQELFTQSKHPQYCADETIQEEGSSTESLDDRDDSCLTGVIVQDEHKIEYTVRFLRNHEFPVIGFHMDDRICPGFKYHVRYLGSDREVFEGEPRALLSVGMGYGKRLTFKGEMLNLNDCYFWTDNNPEGYGFSISVISKGEFYVIYDSLNQRIGDVVIESVELPQVEESMTCSKGDVTKIVRARFTCSIRYHNKLEDTLYDIANQDLQTVEGKVEVVKSRKSKEAAVVCIRDVAFEKVGNCTLWNELL